jgi:SAM-dependent methyltransferase
MVEPLREDAVAFWGEAMAAEEPLREARFPLVEFQTAIAWRVLEDYLGGRLRVLDAGAGTGRYSLPIAARGHRVTHLDVAPAMLRLAMEAAARQGLADIEFRQGDVRNLAGLASRAYDLTLCMDAPLSYAWPRQAQALAEVCRVTREVLVLMVSSRTGVLPFMLDFDLAGSFVPPGQTGRHDPFFLSEAVLRGGVEDYPAEFRPWLAAQGKLTPPDYAFTVPELTALLREQGFAVERLGGPGALARSIRPEHLERIRADRALFQRFVGYSLAFDFDPHCAGLGAVNLLVVARRRGDVPRTLRAGADTRSAAGAGKRTAPRPARTRPAKRRAKVRSRKSRAGTPR